MTTSSQTTPIRTYFLGTGDIAISVLQALATSPSIDLVGVGTQPDQPKGRKKVPTPSPLGAAAEKIESLTTIDKPTSVNTPEFLDQLRALNPEVIVVIAFGQLLKQPLLDLAPFGCINLHASILPKYRGASPINAVILNGEEKTGITIMQIELALDAGPIHSIHEQPISDEDTYASLQDKLGQLGGERIVDSLTDICRHQGTFKTQDHSAATHVGKISKKDGLIDWNDDAQFISRKARAYFPWPTLYFRLKAGKRERTISLIKTSVIEDSSSLSPGEYIQADKQGWIIKCGKNALRLDRIKPDGSGEMGGTDFLRGIQL